MADHFLVRRANRGGIDPYKDFRNTWGRDGLVGQEEFAGTTEDPGLHTGRERVERGGPRVRGGLAERHGSSVHQRVRSRVANGPAWCQFVRVLPSFIAITRAVAHSTMIFQ